MWKQILFSPLLLLYTMAQEQQLDWCVETNDSEEVILVINKKLFLFSEFYFVSEKRNQKIFTFKKLSSC